MTWIDRSFIVTIQGDSEGTLSDITVQDVYRATVERLALPTHLVQVREVSSNISVQNPGQRKRTNPKVNASKGMDLDEALAIACQEPMTQAQKRQRDSLIVSSLNAGLTPEQMAGKTGLSVQSIHLIRREARDAAASRT